MKKKVSKKNKKIHVPARIPTAIIEDARKMSKEHGLTFSMYVEKALRYYNNLEIAEMFSSPSKDSRLET